MKETPDFSKGNGLIPVIVQHHASGDVLMLGYQNEEAWKKTLETGFIVFYSRSKNRLWMKGETSGNTLKWLGSKLDCDNDAILYRAIPHGSTCHTGTNSCFGNELQSDLGFLNQLEQVIHQRFEDETEIKSYVKSLKKQGVARMAQKVGEEGLEVALEAVQGNKQKLVEESADLVFHLLVLLRSQHLSLKEIVQVLHHRHLT